MLCRSFFLLATRIDKRINPIECKIESGSLPRILLKTVQTKIYETFADRWYLEPILITPEWPIDTKAMVPLKGFRDEQTKKNQPLSDFGRIMEEN